MKRGAVAIFDALGFKGIWERHPPAEVLAKLRGFKEGVEDRRLDLGDRVRRLGQHLGIAFEIHVALLSDSVVVGVSGSIVDHHDQRDLGDVDAVTLLGLARMTGQILVMAAKTHPPLAYRGCIATGEFDMEDTFVIGPAVDEAAQWMNNAEGAFVWLTTRARDAFVASGFDKDQELTAMLTPYRVPLKAGRARCPLSRASSSLPPAPDAEFRDTFCVNDSASIDELDERVAHVRRVLDTFGGGPTQEILLKQQNTARFYLEMNRGLRPLPKPREPPQE